jgi:hypothetical protein
MEPIRPDEIKIESGTMPPVRAAGRESQLWAGVFGAIAKLPEGGWFVVPRTEGAFSDDKAQRRAYAARQAINKHLQRAGVKDVAMSWRRDDGALIVRRASALVTPSGRPIDQPPANPPARPAGALPPTGSPDRPGQVKATKLPAK